MREISYFFWWKYEYPPRITKCLFPKSNFFFHIFLGFLRRNKRKDKKKKSTGKDEDGVESTKDIGSDGEDVHKSGTPTPEVDEEGYSKQPPPPTSGGRGNDPWSDFNNQSKGFDSSSDDSDDDTMKRKIKVEIKPVNTNDVISASVDELRTAVGILELPPPPSVVSVAPIFSYVKFLQST